MVRRVSLFLGLWVSTLSLPALAGPAQVRLKPGFTPHPYVSELIDREVNAKVYVSDLGFNKCGGHFSTKEPWFTFRIEEPMTDINVMFQNPGGDNLTNAILVFPNGAYACAKHGNVYSEQWPAGEYKVWFHTSAQKVRAIVRIEQPDRLKKEVFRALSASPNVRFVENPSVNPQFLSIPPAPSAHARVLETRCARGTQSVYPLARLTVERKGRFRVRGSRAKVLIESATGCVTDEATRQNNTLYNDEYVLAAGTYTVWASGEPGKDAPHTLLEVDDLSQPLAFGDPAHVGDLGTLAQPKLLTAKTRAPERWPGRRNACQYGKGAPRAPDFLIKTSEPLQGVRLSLYRNDADLKIRVYGPLEEAKPYEGMVCDVEQMRFITLEGTYAVWVSGGQEAVGTEYHLLALRESAKIDPMKTLLEIPETLTLDQRVISDHYPFFRNMSYGYLFPRAPERLFVYAAKNLKAGDQVVAAGEPLVVVGVQKDTFDLRRYDGTALRARRTDISTERPAHVVLPTKPSFQPAKTFDDAWRLVTPADKATVDRINAATDKYRACVGGWMAKNDPTWGKSYDLVYLSGPNQGKTLSDLKFDQAAEVCGEPTLIKAQEAFRLKINAAAKQRVTTHLRAVRKRFGSSG